MLSLEIKSKLQMGNFDHLSLHLVGVIPETPRQYTPWRSNHLEIIRNRLALFN